MFVEWMRVNHPLIYLLFMLGHYTHKLQSCDIVFQQPFKAKIHKRLSEYVFHELSCRLAIRKDDKARSLWLDITIGSLRNELLD